MKKTALKITGVVLGLTLVSSCKLFQKGERAHLQTTGSESTVKRLSTHELRDHIARMAAGDDSVNPNKIDPIRGSKEKKVSPRFGGESIADEFYKQGGYFGTFVQNRQGTQLVYDNKFTYVWNLDPKNPGHRAKPFVNIIKQVQGKKQLEMLKYIKNGDIIVYWHPYENNGSISGIGQWRASHGAMIIEQDSGNGYPILRAMDTPAGYASVFDGSTNRTFHVFRPINWKIYKYNNSLPTGRKPLSAAQMDKLNELYGKNLAKWASIGFDKFKFSGDYDGFDLLTRDQLKEYANAYLTKDRIQFQPGTPELKMYCAWFVFANFSLGHAFPWEASHLERNFRDELSFLGLENFSRNAEIGATTSPSLKFTSEDHTLPGNYLMQKEFDAIFAGWTDSEKPTIQELFVQDKDFPFEPFTPIELGTNIIDKIMGPFEQFLASLPDGDTPEVRKAFEKNLKARVGLFEALEEDLLSKARTNTASRMRVYRISRNDILGCRFPDAEALVEGAREIHAMRSWWQCSRTCMDVTGPNPDQFWRHDELLLNPSSYPEYSYTFKEECKSTPEEEARLAEAREGTRLTLEQKENELKKIVFGDYTKQRSKLIRMVQRFKELGDTRREKYSRKLLEKLNTKILSAQFKMAEDGLAETTDIFLQDEVSNMSKSGIKRFEKLMKAYGVGGTEAFDKQAILAESKRILTEYRDRYFARGRAVRRWVPPYSYMREAENFGALHSDAALPPLVYVGTVVNENIIDGVGPTIVPDVEAEPEDLVLEEGVRSKFFSHVETFSTGPDLLFYCLTQAGATNTELCKNTGTPDILASCAGDSNQDKCLADKGMFSIEEERAMRLMRAKFFHPGDLAEIISDEGSDAPISRDLLDLHNQIGLPIVYWSRLVVAFWNNINIFSDSLRHRGRFSNQYIAKAVYQFKRHVQIQNPITSVVDKEDRLIQRNSLESGESWKRMMKPFRCLADESPVVEMPLNKISMTDNIPFDEGDDVRCLDQRLLENSDLTTAIEALRGPRG